MHGSLGHFKATLQRRKARQEASEGRFEKTPSTGLKTEAPPQYNFPELGEVELEELKKEIRDKLTSRNRKETIFYVTLVIVVCAVVFYFM